jgi:hypothetical protein
VLDRGAATGTPRTTPRQKVVGRRHSGMRTRGCLSRDLKRSTQSQQRPRIYVLNQTVSALSAPPRALREIVRERRRQPGGGFEPAPLRGTYSPDDPSPALTAYRSTLLRPRRDAAGDDRAACPSSCTAGAHRRGSRQGHLYEIRRHGPDAGRGAALQPGFPIWSWYLTPIGSVVAP